MNRGSWLILIATILWFAFSIYWYTCRIKEKCPIELVTLFSNGATSNLGFTNDNGPVSFSWNDHNPRLNENFDSSIIEILNRMGPNDTLLVIGKYYESESGIGLAKLRAEEVKTHVVNYIESTRVKTDGMLDTYGSPSKRKPFDAVRFLIVPAFEVDLDSAMGNNTQFAETPKPASTSSTTPKQSNEVKSNTSRPANTFRGPLDLTVMFKDRSVYILDSPEGSVAIFQFIQKVKQAKRFRMDVVGFTDAGPSYDDNYFLGRKRAWAIKKLLMDGGLNPNWIYTDSKGGTVPVGTSGNSPDNQRVEVSAVILE